MVPDTLHLLLRVVDRLFGRLLDDFVVLAMHGLLRTNPSSAPLFKPVKTPNDQWELTEAGKASSHASANAKGKKAAAQRCAKEAIKALVAHCGINGFDFYEEKLLGGSTNASKTIAWSGFQGPDARRFLKRFEDCFCDCFLGGMPSRIYDTHLDTWGGFAEIYFGIVNSDNILLGYGSYEQAQEKIEAWFERCIESPGQTTVPLSNEGMYRYMADIMTPYLHVLRCHVVEYTRFHGGSIKRFSCQGIEYANCKENRIYFRSSSRRLATVLLEVMLHRLRLIFNPKKIPTNLSAVNVARSSRTAKNISISTSKYALGKKNMK